MEALTEIVPGPDFPTGGLIIGKLAARGALARGRGSILMRARCAVEEIRKDREAIIVTEIPYMVNKALLQERIAELVRDKRVEGISDIRDESDRHGMRVVIELKRDASSEVVLNQLYRFSQLQTSFGVNMLALNDGRPLQMNLKDLIAAFVGFREEVVTRRTKFELTKARDRGHILVGLAVAVANIDEVIRLIRAAPDAAAAREQLMARAWPAKDVAPLVALIADPRHKMEADDTIRLTEEQAKAILDLRLQRLTALGVDEISDEAAKLGEAIKDYLDILSSRGRVLADHQERTGRHPRRIRHPAQDRADRRRYRDRGRSADRARGCRRHRHPCRLYQAHAAGRIPGAGPRRQGPLRHGDAGRGFRHQPVRRQHPCADAVLLLHRHGLQAESLAAAGSAHRRQGQGDGQSAAAGAKASASPPSWRCRKMRANGTSSMSCSPPNPAMCGATNCPISSRSTRAARSP